MNIEVIRDYCLLKKGVTEGFPFGEDVLVFKVMGKIFALLSLDRLPPSINLKCNPERALELREQYAAVAPGYHMNKKHWNTLHLDGSIPAADVRALIDHSYDLVKGGLPRAVREKLDVP